MNETGEGQENITQPQPKKDLLKTVSRAAGTAAVVTGLTIGGARAIETGSPTQPLEDVAKATLSIKDVFSHSHRESRVVTPYEALEDTFSQALKDLKKADGVDESISGYGGHEARVFQINDQRYFIIDWGKDQTKEFDKITYDQDGNEKERTWYKMRNGQVTMSTVGKDFPAEKSLWNARLSDDQIMNLGDQISKTVGSLKPTQNNQ